MRFPSKTKEEHDDEISRTRVRHRNTGTLHMNYLYSSYLIHKKAGPATQHRMCSNRSFFWSAFSCIRIRKNSVFGYFSHSTIVRGYHLI